MTARIMELSVREKAQFVLNSLVMPPLTLIDPMFEIFPSGDWKCYNCNATFRKSVSVGRHCYKCLSLDSYIEQSRVMVTAVPFPNPTPIKPVPSTCTICSGTFSTKSSLERHVKAVHVGHRPHRCRTCGARFKQKDHLVRHQRVHLNTGKKPYQCAVCKRNFKLRSSYLYHWELHSESKSFPCKICQASFTKSDTLKIHMKTHRIGRDSLLKFQRKSAKKSPRAKLKTKQSKQKCDICKRKVSNLKAHLVVHSEARPFACNVCNTNFKLKKALQAHQRTISHMSSLKKGTK